MVGDKTKRQMTKSPYFEVIVATVSGRALFFLCSEFLSFIPSMYSRIQYTVAILAFISNGG